MDLDIHPSAIDFKSRKTEDAASIRGLPARPPSRFGGRSITFTDEGFLDWPQDRLTLIPSRAFRRPVLPHLPPSYSCGIGIHLVSMCFAAAVFVSIYSKAGFKLRRLEV
jgi:hypothetical protein